MDVFSPELFAQPAFWASLLTLTFLEIVLGIDNLLFVSIASSRLQGEQQKKARKFGIWGAMVLRILMLAGIFWIIRLDSHPLFVLPASLDGLLGPHPTPEALEEFRAFTIKDAILFGGGLFLLYKGTEEIHAATEGTHHEQTDAKTDFTAVLLQMAVINIIFSLDSVITAVGMTDVLLVMIAAVILSTVVMAFASEPLAKFIETHPTTKMLALAFILLVGVALVADSVGFHIPRGYLYFAIAFSMGVELLNIRTRRKSEASGPAPKH